MRVAHPRHDERADRRDANRAVGVSAVGLAITGGVELALAIVTGSVALLGDALHNLSDVSTSAVVFLGFRISKKAPTTGYPYGYERAEDLAGLGVALVIWMSAAFAGYESYRKLVGGEGTSHVGIGMAGAALGIVGNQPFSANSVTACGPTTPVGWSTTITMMITPDGNGDAQRSGPAVLPGSMPRTPTGA